MEKHERHYNIFRLNRLFAVSSLVFLLLLVWTFADDYARPWKSYQRQFRQLEIAHTAGELNGEIQRLSAREDYQQVKKRLSAARKDLEEREGDLKTLEKEASKLEARHYKAQQEHSFTKAKYDAAKYAYEEAVAGAHVDTLEARENLQRLETETHERRLAMEEAKRKLDEKLQSIRSMRREVHTARDSFSRLNRDVDLLIRKLKTIDPSSMTFANRIASLVRDLPVLDFLNPYYKIDQIILNDITQDLNFAQVPKVDRCTTCHLGIAKPGFEDAPQPFTTHPDLELFLATGSPHPVQQFGCTSCHGGRGRGTDFITSAHTPDSPEEEEEWSVRYEWHEMHHWDDPMFPVKYAEAGCFKCHSEEIFVRGADRLNLGTNLIERAGCFGCHTIERYKDKRRIGPDLNKIASKVSRDWAYLWIRNPKLFRHNTWMPRFFGLANTSDSASVTRTNNEIHAIVHYLFDNSGDFPLEPIPVKGDIQRGRDLTHSLGCMGCHRIEAEPTSEKTSLQSLRRDHGPNLIGLASKSNARWVYNWLKEPERYFPRTKMPNLRLTDRETADITAYLMSLPPREEFLQQEIPELREDVIDEVVLNFLSNMFSDYDSRQRLSGMNLEEKLDYAGEKLLRFYGCYGCHNIPGFEEEKPIGTELTEEGSKAVEKLDFGLLDIDHTRQSWFKHKLKHPRSFDRNKVKRPYEKLRMPNFEFTDTEADAIVTALLGFVKTSYGVKPIRSQNPDVHQGQWLVREYNCQGCHIIEGDGGAVRPTITEWLVETNDMDPAEAEEVSVDFSPPNLHTQGARTQPGWLFDFFKHPTIIRPSLRVRMPTFHLSDDEWNSIIKYFQFLEDEVNAYESPHTVDVQSIRYHAGEKLHEMGACSNCHFYGSTFPLGKPESWGPNLAMTRNRLRPEWVVDFLRDPQAIMPDTRMPKPYVPTDRDLEASDASEIFGRAVLSLKGNPEAMLWGLADYVFSLPGKTDITKEVTDYFDEHGYQFFKVEEEEWEEWEDWEE
ncbi:MAG: c-type cytochrome [Fidelibacterota bacterium]